MDRREIMNKAHDNGHVSLYDFNYTNILPDTYNEENMTHRNIMILIRKLNSILEETNHPLWVKLLLSIPDKTLPERLQNDPPSTGSSSQMNSILNDPKKYDPQFEKLNYNEIKKALQIFEEDIQRLDHISWSLNFLSDPSTSNESQQSLLLYPIISDTIALLRELNVFVALNYQKSIGVNTVSWEQEPISPEFERVLKVKPDFLIEGEVNGYEVAIPFEIKTNLETFCNEIRDTGSVKKSSSLSILKQLMNYSIQSKSSTIIVGDYFKTIVLQINFEKTLTKDEEGTDMINELSFKYVIVENDGTPFTILKLFLWVIYTMFKLRTVEEMKIERSKLRLLGKLMERSHNEIENNEESRTSYLTGELTQSGEMVKVIEDDLDLKVTKQTSICTVLTIPFQKYKLYFDQNLKDEAIDKISIKIWNAEHPFLSDDEELVINFKKDRIPALRQCIIRETKALSAIQNYNELQTDNSMKLNAPRLFGSGSITVFDKYGLIKNIGVYIATSNIQESRNFESKDVENLEKQLDILNKQVGLKHGSIGLEK